MHSPATEPTATVDADMHPMNTDPAATDYNSNGEEMHSDAERMYIGADTMHSDAEGMRKLWTRIRNLQRRCSKLLQRNRDLEKKNATYKDELIQLRQLQTIHQNFRAFMIKDSEEQKEAARQYYREAKNQEKAFEKEKAFLNEEGRLCYLDVFNMRQRVDDAEAENERLKNRVAAVEEENEALRRRCELLESQKKD